MLVTAAKFNPIPSESLIFDSPLLSRVVIVGQGRSQASLLIEPKPGVDGASLIEKIWLLVEQTNNEATTAARIDRSKIAIISPDKPFIRTQKGTVIRKQSLEAYSAELDHLYADEAPA